MPVLRFAPSPNGRLHLGHAYSALLNAQWAQKLSGRLLLRIEDIDTARCTPLLREQCVEDLAWLGLAWETPVRIQSQHFADYRRALERLRARGLMYPCFCSRKDIEARSVQRDPEGAPLYPGTCRGMKAGTVAARMGAGDVPSWRLDMQAALDMAPEPHGYMRVSADGALQRVAADPARWGDVILARKDTPTSYHVSVVVDDALQGITHVVRGVDLEAATDIHVLLQALLGLPTPLYHHHALLMDAGGDKLSKSRRSASLADLRAQGVTPAGVRTMLPVEATA